MRIITMTPAELKNGGESLVINYSFADTPFGNIILAATSKGLCYLAFVDNAKKSVEALKNTFPRANYKKQSDAIQKKALKFFSGNKIVSDIPLHITGTPFQLHVWGALLKIPFGHLVTYGRIAKDTGKTRAFRAVGTAVGANKIAFLIPCHRVIQASGALGGYRWGASRKAALVEWERTLKTK